MSSDSATYDSSPFVRGRLGGGRPRPCEEQVLIKKIVSIIAVLFFSVVLAVYAQAGESGVSPNVISLPSGPGSVQGLGEEFEPSANSGTASYGVTIEAPDGSGGFKPSVKLAYDGGRGNSAVGFGWSMPLPRIQLQTDKGLPRYENADAYIYNDATTGEELVPIADGSFRLKNEGAFIRAIKDGDGWEVRTKGGIIYRLGRTQSTRVQDAGGTRIFAWNISEMEDTNGNIVSFDWISDKGQSYLSKIRYNDFGASVVCEISFTYEARADALADYRAGFAVTTAQRLSRIEVRRGGNLVRAYALSYDPDSILSRLAGVTMLGSDGVTSLPPLAFGYTRFSPQEQGIVEMQNAPGQGLIDGKNALVDLNADSLPDLIVTNPSDHRYYINEDGVNWSQQQVMAQSPSYDLSQAGVRLADFNGDGVSDLVVALGAGGNKFLPGSGEESWLTSEGFDQNPVGFDPADSNTKFIDLNGDRLIDVLRTNLNGVSAWIHLGHGSFERLGPLPKIDPDEQVLLSDTQIVLADFNGDGLLDVARLRSGSLVYWPAIGYGRFDASVAIAAAPHVNDETRLRAADIDGDGLADILYLGINQIDYWLNRGDGSFDGGHSITGTPSVDPINTKVELADMNGNGTTDIVWVDVSHGPAGAWQYLDPIGDQYAGLLTRIDNGLGKQVAIAYTNSTAEMVRAANGGKTWATTLPFPVQVIRSISVNDGLSVTSVSELIYSDGFYDGIEREFRGFAGASKTEQGDDSIDTLVTAWAFDVGKQYEALKGKPLSETASGGNGVLMKRVQNTWTPATLANGTDGRDVVFASLSSAVTSFIEGTSTPRYTREDFSYDSYGNVTLDKKHGEVASTSDDGSTPFGNDEIFVQRSYAANETAWIVDLLSRATAYDSTGKAISDTLSYYDGAPYAGLPLGQVDRGNLMRVERWLDSENRYVAEVRNSYDSWGNIIATLDAAGGRREIAYDETDHVHPVRERMIAGPSVFDFIAEYDAVFGKPISYSDPNGAITSYEYDALGRLSKIIKPGDSSQLPTVGYEYDLKAPVSTITTHAREVSGAADTLDKYTYVDGLGKTRAEAMADVGGGFIVSKASIFNSRGKESFVAEPFRVDSLPLEGGGAGWGWSKASLAAQSGTSFTYNALSRIVTTVHPDGTNSLVQYLPLAELFFDEDDSDASSSHANTPATKRYDGQARLAAVSYRDSTKDIPTSFGYDAAGNITSITDTAGNLRTQTYDSLGRMTAIDDPNAGHRDYIYDDTGNLIEKRKPGGEGVKYKYEQTTNRVLAKNIYTGTDDDTWEVLYHYDAPSADWGNGGNLKGRLAWVEDASGKEYIGYDARGNVTAKHRVIGSNAYDLAFVYDAMDRQTRVTYPDGSPVDTTYNDRGLVDSVGQYLSGRIYNAAGQVVSEVLGGGIARTYSYDVRRRMIDQLAQGASGDAIQELHYGFDGVGNILKIDDGRAVAPEKLQTQAFSYDDLYRLTRADVTGGNLSWAYDDVGNITQRANTLGDARLYSDAVRYGENGAGPYAQTSADDIAYQYDANGRLIGMPSRTLAWDAEDRLTSVTKDDGTVVTMTYDYDGKRAIKYVARPDGTSDETDYIDASYEIRYGKGYKYIFVDGKRIARAEVQPLTSALLSPSLEGRGEGRVSPVLPIAFLTLILPIPFARNPRRAIALLLVLSLAFGSWAGGISGCGGGGASSNDSSASAPQHGVIYYIDDHLGSAEIITDSNGNVLREESRYPYGLDRSTDNPGAVTADYVYTGKELDAETSLIYFGGRYYAPEMGRWTSPDPIFTDMPQQLLKKPWEINLYTYAINNPVNYIDRDGLYAGIDDAIALGAGAVIGMTAQGIADYRNGSELQWENYVGAAVGGAAGGEFTLYSVNPVLGSAGASMMGNAATQVIRRFTRGESINMDNLAHETLIGGVFGLLPGGKAAGVTTGKGSMLAVKNQIVTKLANEQIDNITTNTAGKMVAASFVKDAYIEGSLLYSPVKDMLSSETNELTIHCDAAPWAKDNPVPDILNDSLGNTGFQANADNE